MFTNSYFLDILNKILYKVQNSNAARFMRDSLIFLHIDFLIWIMFILTILSTCRFSSGVIGGFALIFSLLNIFKILVKPGETARISKMDTFLIVYFLFLVVALMGSSLFMMSLKGFLKEIVYFLFYFTSVYFFLNNRAKILPTVFIIAAIMSYESAVAVFQHFNKVEALAGWVDTSHMSSESQLLSRSFGTLKPSNPNLLGGYLITGLSCVFAYFTLNFLHKNRARMIIFGVLFVLNLTAIIFTGCRGAYLGLIAFFLIVFWAVNYYVKKVWGGFKNIKKRYKNLLAGLVGGGILIILLSPSILRRFVSIFHFRGDSSISFRMNVYEAAAKMFQDNPFLGIGLGNVNFREIYGLYMKTGFDALGSYCVPLEIAVESGIFSLIFFLIFVFYALYKAFRASLSDKNPAVVRVIMFSIVLSVASTMAHGLFDTVWYRPQLQIIFWTNIAILNARVIEENTGLKARG